LRSWTVRPTSGEFPAQRTSTEPFSAHFHAQLWSVYVFGKEARLILKE
jgi:hypothetical protein